MNKLKVIRYVSFLILIFVTVKADAQIEQRTCGTQAYKSDWLKKYQKNPASFYKMNDSIIYVPITVQSVAHDNGFGSFAQSKVLEAMCTLNTDFSDANIQFYLQKTIQVLPATQYLDHFDIPTGAEMMFANNVPNTINNYIVKTAAGNCGYNLPYAGIALNINCITPEDHTWSHEVGHNLGLPHPFLGWEGGVSHDGTVSHNFANPAPEYVTYNYTLFQDTLILDTLIIDTALVEKMDGSNCYIAGDGFCDTPPDYLAYRWQCNPDVGFSSEIQTDPDDIQFQSDGSLIMSYALDVCANRFSPEQIDAMRANLLDEKSTYLDASYTAENITDYTTVLRLPEAESLVGNQELEFFWDPVEHADFYLFRLYEVNPFLPDLLITKRDTLVASNSMFVEALSIDREYLWEVAPITDFDFCTLNNSDRSSFTTTLVSSVEEDLVSEGISVYPSIAAVGDNITVEKNANESYDIAIYDIAGKLIYNEFLNQDKITLSTETWNKGMYVVQFRKQKEIFVKKILIF